MAPAYQVTLEVDRTHRERWTSPGIYSLLSSSQVSTVVLSSSRISTESPFLQPGDDRASCPPARYLHGLFNQDIYRTSCTLSRYLQNLLFSSQVSRGTTVIHLGYCINRASHPLAGYLQSLLLSTHISIRSPVF
jgi:hypothetical protein